MIIIELRAPVTPLFYMVLHEGAPTFIDGRCP
jgi:hypothetical protein